MTEEQKLQYIVGNYSLENRQNQLMEEMSELTQAILKLRRMDIKNGTEAWKNYIEEVVDVQLCLDMIKVFLSSHEDEMEDIRRFKIDRQIERIKNKIYMDKGDYSD